MPAEKNKKGKNLPRPVKKAGLPPTNPNRSKANTPDRPRENRVLDEAKVEQMASLFVIGCPTADSCAVVGVSLPTFCNMMRRGQEAQTNLLEIQDRSVPRKQLQEKHGMDSRELDQFEERLLNSWDRMVYVRLLKAQGVRTAEALKNIRSASLGEPDQDGVPTKSKQWYASAWLLERTDRKRFGRPWAGPGDNSVDPLQCATILQEVCIKHWARHIPEESLRAGLDELRSRMTALAEGKSAGSNPETRLMGVDE